MYRVDIISAARMLKQGGVVALPTETVWGLAARADSPKAVEALLALKPGRKKPLTLFPEAGSDPEAYAVLNRAGQAVLSSRLVPGPLVLVLDSKVRFKGVVQDDGSIGMRLPDHPVPRELLKAVDFPLATTSANPPGQEPARQARQVHEYFPEIPLLQGEAGQARPSTVVDLRSDPAKLLRRGPVGLAELEAVAGVPVVPFDQLRVLFVCSGGVDRSPAASRWLYHQGLGGVVSDHLGTLWKTEEIEQKCWWADLIFPMTEEHRDVLVEMGVNQHKIQEPLGVPDPYGQKPETRKLIFSFMESVLEQKVLPRIIRNLPR